MATKIEIKYIKEAILAINKKIGLSYISLLDKVPSLIEKFYEKDNGFLSVQDEINAHLSGVLEFSQLKYYDAFYLLSYQDQMRFNKVQYGLGYNFSQADTKAIKELSSVNNWFTSKYQTITDQSYTLKQMRESWEKGFSVDKAVDNLKGVISRSNARAQAHTKTAIITNNSRIRSTADLKNFDQNGIKGYEFKAVIDNVTTDICRSLDGKQYLIRPALELQEKINKDVRGIMDKGGSDWQIYNNAMKYLHKNDALANENKDGKFESEMILRTKNPEVQGKRIKNVYKKAEDVPGNNLPRPPMEYNCRSRIKPLI